jgi:hypothetical protein
MSQEKLEGERPERGSAAGSGKHPPHPEGPAGEGSDDLPATAHGSDTQPGEDQPTEVDDESMYDRRPGQDKDQPPSGRD